MRDGDAADGFCSMYDWGVKAVESRTASSSSPSATALLPVYPRQISDEPAAPTSVQGPNAAVEYCSLRAIPGAAAAWPAPRPRRRRIIWPEEMPLVAEFSPEI